MFFICGIVIGAVVTLLLVILALGFADNIRYIAKGAEFQEPDGSWKRSEL